MSTEITNAPEGRVASFRASQLGEPAPVGTRDTQHALGWCPTCIKDGRNIRGSATSIIKWAQRLREEVEENKELDDVLISGLAFSIEMAAVDIDGTSPAFRALASR